MSPRRIAKALTGFGAVALIVLVGATVYIVHYRSTLSIKKIAGIVPGALLHAHNFHWVQMKAGKPQWTLTARDASYSASKTSIVLTDAQLKMKSKDGKQVFVDAPHAALTLKDNHVIRATLSGGTQVRYGEFLLAASQVTFLPDEDRMEAPGLVTIKGKGVEITGIGLVGHPKARQFELLKQVHTRFTPRPHRASSSKQS